MLTTRAVFFLFETLNYLTNVGGNNQSVMSWSDLQSTVYERTKPSVVTLIYCVPSSPVSMPGYCCYFPYQNMEETSISKPYWMDHFDIKTIWKLILD